ncbi:MAG: carboxypeptidase regulatory-like domain-containing protein [Phycisphaerae bacterium]|nr:carboxypeptidase regulatory-like domain-containing protein [Phycisphaerae bacterium]
MNAFVDAARNLISGPLAADLAKALLHTLWQAPAVAAALYLLLKTVVTRNADLRYNLAAAALALIVICPMLTFGVLNHQSHPAPAAIVTNPDPDITPAIPAPERTTLTQATISNAYTPAPAAAPTVDWHRPMISLWLAGVAFMLCRAAWMVYGASRLKQSCTPVSDTHLETLLDDLRQKMHIARHVGIAAVDRIASPAVVGFIRPTILLPLSMMTGMPAEDISAILAHELAHIKRFDCLVNFAQMIVEALLFFNPAVWLVSRQIRIEREACCDAASVFMTGQKLGYARLLYAWAVRLSDASKDSAAAAMVSFGDNAENGGMLDRVQRIAVKGHRPRMRISGAMTVAMIAAVGILLIGLWHGTQAGIELAGRILTPHERIEKMAEIQKTHGQPAYDHEASRSLTEDEKVTLSGIVRTWDGLPLPEKAYMTVHTQRPGHGISAAISIDRKEPGHASFSTRGSYGVVYISAHTEGYSPFFVGPFELEPGDEKHDIEVIFQEARHAEIQLVDADSGQPIQGVQLTGGHAFHPGGWHYTITAATDDQGKASIAFVENVPVTLRAKADLYEHTQFEKITVSPTEPLILKMRKALPATGTVLSAATGQPVPGAQIRIQRHLQGVSYGRDQGDVLATTDADGRFTITSLNAGSKYILAVKADGFAYAFVPDVSPGDTDINVQLQNQLTIKGQVIGPLEKLWVHKGETAVNYTCGHEYDHHGHWDKEQYAPITQTDDGVFFEIDDVWGNRINIGPARYKQSLDFDKNEIPPLLVLDLREKTAPDGAPYTKRTVVLNFNVPKDAPPVQGNVRIASFDPDKGYSYGKLVDVVDNRAQTEIVAPGTFSYELADTIGYWFKSQHGIKVDSNPEPYVLTVDAVPAGTIFGEVFDHDGSPVGNTIVSFATVEKSPLLGKDVHFDGVEGKNSTSEAERQTKFSIQPLPLGGKYRVIPHQGYMYLVSDTITLTEEQPIRRLDLTFPKGVTLTGKVLHPDGSPAAGLEYDLSFKANKAGSFGRGPRYTDAEGAFTCENVNPKADGTYTFVVKSNKTWRPLRVEVDDFKKPLTVTLEQGAVAAGRIIDSETGWPVPGVQVSAFFYDNVSKESDHIYAEEKTDNHGHFRFSTLKQGRTYQLMTSGANIASRTQPQITGGQPEEATCSVKIPEWSDLKPKKPD